MCQKILVAYDHLKLMLMTKMIVMITKTKPMMMPMMIIMMEAFKVID